MNTQEARRTTESILKRELLETEIDRLIEKTNPSKMLLWVFLNPKKSEYLRGYDARRMIEWLGLSEEGDACERDGVWWLRVRSIKGPTVVPGKRLSSKLFIQMSDSQRACFDLVWIPTGMILLTNVSIATCESNTERLDVLGQLIVEFYEYVRRTKTSKQEAENQERQLQQYKGQLMALTRERPREVACQM